MLLGSTKHFRTRAQQRAIPSFIANFVVENGASIRRGQADVYFLDKEARQRVRRQLGRRIYDTLIDFFDVYVVCGDARQFITVGWRLDRIKRP
jgi:hypothetical protein